MAENASTNGSAIQVRKDGVLAALLNEKYRLDRLKKLTALIDGQHFKDLRHFKDFKDFKDSRDFKYFKDFVAVLAKITLYWLKDAKEANIEPLKHCIQFGEWRGHKLTITLAQVHNLFPEAFQAMLQTNHIRPSADAAWLDENVLNTLVWLNTPSSIENGSNKFAINIGSLIRRDLDDYYRDLYLQQAGMPLDKPDTHEIGYLDYLEQQIQLGEDTPEAKTFLFPASSIKKIVWFENYLGVHWTTIVMEPGADKWRYYSYNSAKYRDIDKDPEVFKQLPKLQSLILKISDFPEPTHPFSAAEIELNKGPLQKNSSDCGVFAFWSAIEALRGNEPNPNIDPVFLRLAMLRSIAAALRKRFPESEVEVKDNNSAGGDDASDDDHEVGGFTQGGKQDGDVEGAEQDTSHEAMCTTDKSQYESKLSDEEFQKLLDARLEEDIANEVYDTLVSDGEDAFGLEVDSQMDRDDSFEDGDEDTEMDEGDSYE